MCSLYYDSRCKCKLVYFFVQSLKSPQTKAEELIVIFEEFHVVFKVSFFVGNPVLCFSSLKNAKILTISSNVFEWLSNYGKMGAVNVEESYKVRVLNYNLKDECCY